MVKPKIQIDPNKNLRQWFIFPDSLEGGKFRSYETRPDESQNRGAFPVGQNVTFDGTGNPTLRPGYEVFGTEQSNSTPVKRAWVHETRGGAQFQIRFFSTQLQYYLHGESTDWGTLLTGLTDVPNMGYANIGESGEATGHSYFDNGTDSWYRFNGAYTRIASVTLNTITKSGATTWTQEGFYTTGTRSVIINGSVFAYTGGEGTTTLTGVTPDPTGLVSANDLGVQSPQAVSALSSFLSSVMMAHDGRIHARQETRPSVSNYSQLDNPDDFTAGALDGNGGAKEIEFGGPIVAYGKLNKTALIFKKKLIKSLDFIQSGDRIDVPRYATLTSADDKSTTLGATNQKSTFSCPLGIVFLTPDKRLVILTGVTANNEPQYFVISEPIQPVFDRGIHDEGTGICFNNQIFYSFKESIDSTYNDVVVRADLTRSTFDNQGRTIPVQWDAPFIGWNVNDWTISYDDTNGQYSLFWHSSINSNTYRIIDDKVDNTQAFTATIRSWAENFGVGYKQKTIDQAFIEIKMLENTVATATLLYDEDGVTNQTSFTLLGTDQQRVFTKTSFNPFGASAFGSQRIGSNEGPDEKNLYRFFLEIDPNIHFFTLSLQLSTDGENNDFEGVRFGYRIKEVFETTNDQYLISPLE